jgi:uncharacterized membrane protein
MSATEPRINQPRTEPGLDPLRLCIFTTISVIAWIVTPPLAALWFSGVGIWGYAAARRAGLLRSRCVLGDTRLVLVYLEAVFAVAAWFTLQQLVDWLG